MTLTAGIDVGSTYTKCVLVGDDGKIVGSAVAPTGFKLAKISRTVFDRCLEQSGIDEREVRYIVATGIGRHQVDFKDIHVTDLTAGARGAMALFPGTRTVLDVGGQTMKASRLDESCKVISFRLNDKCAAGTGAFLEKTARYMGFGITEISSLLTTSKEPVPISGVCAVFAESEVINHLSMGTAPSDIMQGAVESLVGRSAQLIRRVKAQPEFTLIGGILQFETFGEAVRRQLESEVNVPDKEVVQFVSALGAGLLGHRRLQMLSTKKTPQREGNVA
jgi:predicted CoA-substrate-specific enzyme activase